MSQSIKVSLLIAARNEQKVIGRLLQSIDALEYDRDYMQVILGNDHSDDLTLQIMETWASGKPWVAVMDIPERKADENLRGKARALAMMAHHALGEYLFFTDADVSLPNQWINGMLSELDLPLEHDFSAKKIGVLVGVTGMKPYTFASSMQALEWFMVIMMNKEMSDRGIATTGMGNNMVVLKSAYFELGGYEKIGFSIVEDYTLYKKIIAAGYDFRQVFKPEVVAYTLPAENYFEQRKRWVAGAMEDKSGPLFLGLMQALSLPLYLLIAYFNWKVSLALFIAVACFYAFKTLKFQRLLAIKGYLKYIPLFSFYLPISWFAQFVNYFLPGKIVWKGRQF